MKKSLVTSQHKSIERTFKQNSMQYTLLSFCQKNWRALISISISIIFFLYAAYNYILILHPSTALTDWLDYPLMVFILEQNITHLSQLDFANIANITSYYPSPGGMFFTDVLFVQGVVGTALFPLTKNYILTHNIIFFLTALTNIVALQYFWSKLFKKQLIVTLVTFLFVFSPYYFSMYVHFQMIGYAFFFFSAGKLLTAHTQKDYFWAGILSGLQFLVGVYLGFYSLAFAALFFIWKLWKKETLKKIIVHGFWFGLGFILIAGWFVYMFAKIKHNYAIERSAGFYIDLALQPTDWLFNPYDSIWSRLVYKHVNAFGHRKGPHFSPGWILLGTALAGLFSSCKKKKSSVSWLMLMLLVWGIIAGLGPRLTVNGHYYGTILPYAVLLKFTPFFDALRATGRWFFLIQIGLVFFVGVYLEQLQKQVSKKIFLLGISVGLALYVCEIVPLTQRTEIQSYQTEADSFLQRTCKKREVLLEYPFGTVGPDVDVRIVLNYWVKILLNQMHHECYIVNGYSGFDPTHYLDYKQAFEQAIKAEDAQKIMTLLAEKNVTYIKLNHAELFEEVPSFLQELHLTTSLELVYKDAKTSIFAVPSHQSP